MRATHRQAEFAFFRLCEISNARIARSYNDVGAWRLDHGYHGYRVEEIINAQGAVTHPIIDLSLKPAAFVQTIWFAIRAIEASQRERRTQ